MRPPAIRENQDVGDRGTYFAGPKGRDEGSFDPVSRSRTHAQGGEHGRDHQEHQHGHQAGTKKKVLGLGSKYA